MERRGGNPPRDASLQGRLFVADEGEDAGPTEVVSRHGLALLERVDQGRFDGRTVEAIAVHDHVPRAERANEPDGGAEASRVGEALVAAGEQPHQRRVVAAVTVDGAM